MDFAGGNVVHISSGVAGLMATIVVGSRQGAAGGKKEPHNALLTFIGASLLWIGWFGFNAGSAVTANARAGQAAVNTQLATAMSAASWCIAELVVTKKFSILSLLSGAISGLVAITPACGFVDQTGAFFIGLLAGPWCYMCAQLKNYAGFEDSLDGFGVHATGGFLGSILTGFFANPIFFGPYTSDGVYPSVRPDNPTSLYYAGVFYAINKQEQETQLGIQAYGAFVTIFYVGVVSLVILKLVDATLGLSVPDTELEDLDSSLHGEAVALKQRVQTTGAGAVGAPVRAGVEGATNDIERNVDH